MIRGCAKKDKRTKNLINRLNQNDIAVILHRDIDEVAAIQLIERKVRAVINGDEFISGRYPNQGPKLLFKAGIPLIDNIGSENFDKICENDDIEISEKTLSVNGKPLCSITMLTGNDISRKMETASENLKYILHDFIDNTLIYAEKEKDVLLTPLKMPSITTSIKGRHVLVVIRGKNYKDDLKAIRSYIKEVKPVMIGVDGGGDALLEFGCKPDMIVGDMDSVSDRCLMKCKEIIVHAYPDGTSPGLDRIRKIGLNAKLFPYPGTSEDVALILAYENNAELIVTVGSHTNMIDFLDKGRKGMASTLLVRMKVGYKIIDAKGVSELYRNRLRPAYIAALFAAAMFPIAIIAKSSPLIRELYSLIALRLKILIGM